MSVLTALVAFVRAWRLRRAEAAWADAVRIAHDRAVSALAAIVDEALARGELNGPEDEAIDTIQRHARQHDRILTQDDARQAIRGARARFQRR